MEKKIYYQAQWSEDGKTWNAFNANHKYYVRETYEEIKEVYDRMIEYHKSSHLSHCKYHRIVKFVVESEVINENV